jgi:hypothetical protein
MAPKLADRIIPKLYALYCSKLRADSDSGPADCKAGTIGTVRASRVYGHASHWVCTLALLMPFTQHVPTK